MKKMATWLALPAILLLGILPGLEAQEGQPHESPAQDSTTDVHEFPLTAGYEKVAGKGFFIRTQEDLFRLGIGLYTTARWSLNHRKAAPAGEKETTTGYSQNRTRIIFEGHYSETFDFNIRFNIDDQGDWSTLVSYLQWNIDPAWNLRAGLQFMALSREDWQWAEDILTTDFSPVDSTFAMGTSVGVQANYQGELNRFWLGLGDGTYGAKGVYPNGEDSNATLTSRWEHQLLGKDWSSWDDLVGRRGRARGILMGLSAAWQQADTAATSDNGAQGNADLSFNGDGYQAMAAASFTSQHRDGGERIHHWSFFAQGGYFVSKHVQAYGQYNLISPGNESGNLEDFQSVAIGTSFFPFLWTNRWRFSAEFGYLFSALDNTSVSPSTSMGWYSSSEGGQYYFRIQAGFGF